MTRRLWWIVLLLIVAAAAAGWHLALTRPAQPFKGYDGVEQFVDLLPGEGTGTIARKLVSGGVVCDRWTFRLALWRTGAARRLKAGEYRFDKPMTTLEVVSMIEHGNVFLRQVTFPEGLTLKEMSQIFESRGLGSAASFIAAARDGVALVEDTDPSARDLEGYLFPETYALSRHAGAADLVRMMVVRFHQVLTPDLRAAAAAEGLTPRQVITLASLVEKETARAEERPMVAGVYLRRLQAGMPLQCDPTVIFALVMMNRYDGNLTHANLLVDSPYNTYRYLGLPPGPIAAPGRASIEAAAHPADVDYLYFVSRNDGSHVFARTLEEHTRNVQKYQVEYFRRQKTDSRR